MQEYQDGHQLHSLEGADASDHEYRPCLCNLALGTDLYERLRDRKGTKRQLCPPRDEEELGQLPAASGLLATAREFPKS